MALAEKWERQARQLAPAVHLQNRGAILEAFIGATQKAVEGDFTEASAREVLDRILEATGQGAVNNETTREFADRWLQARAHELAPGTRTAYEHALRLFLAHLGSMAGKPLGSVTTRQIESFKASRIAEGRSAKTVDRDLKVVRSLFSAASHQGQIRFDPTRAVSLLTRKGKTKSQRVTREIFSFAELDAVLGVADGDWLTTTLIGRYTGARLSDCVQMGWSNIDFGEDLIRYTDEKTGKHYTIPMHHRLHTHLLKIVEIGQHDHSVCPSLADKQTGGCNGLSAQFIKLMEKAGVDPRYVETKSVQRVEGKRRMMATRSFHSLRHTYNSELANADVSQEIRRKLVGHSDDEMNDVYTHLDVGLFRAAIDKLK